MNFRHYVSFQLDQSNDDTVDPSWVTYESPSSLADVPCNIKPVSGGEVVYGRQLQLETTHLIETRYQSGINSQLQILDKDSVVYTINRIIDDNHRNRYLILECTEVG